MFLSKTHVRGTLVAQSLGLGSGYGLEVVRSSPRLGSALSGESAYLPLPLPLPQLTHALSP